MVREDQYKAYLADPGRFRDLNTTADAWRYPETREVITERGEIIQKAVHYSNPNQKQYDYVLSYNQAIRFPARAGADRQYFQGSSLNRKKKPVDESETIQTPAQASDERFYKALHDQHVRSLKSVPRSSPLEGRSMSRRSKQKVRDKITAMYKACQGRPGYRDGQANFTFVTLTLIAPAPDRTACDVLNKWRTAVVERYGKFAFVWVAERQQNGRIHFHLVADRRFDIPYINSLWVIQQINSGIINERAVGLLRMEKNLSFKNLHDQERYSEVQAYLNPADVRSIKTIDGISCYLTNYVTKNEGKFQCAPWHSSRSVSKLFTKQIISRRVFARTGDANKNKIVSRKGREYVNKTYIGQYCTINTIYNKAYYKKYLKELETINRWIIENHTQIDTGVAIDESYYINILYSSTTSPTRGSPKDLQRSRSLPAKKIHSTVDQSDISNNLPAWQPVSSWDLN